MLSAMEATAVTKEASRVGIAPGKVRKALTLPKELVDRVRVWRHAHRIDPESEAYAQLLEKALNASEREEREQKARKS
jgi:hypothetical protein